MGHIIPAGTGYPKHRNIKVDPLVEPIEIEEESTPELEEPVAG
jgi:hypothetical protein